MVAGGGVVFVRAIKALDDLELEGDQATGAGIIRRVLEEPLRQIAANSGLEGAIVVQKVASRAGAVGYNALTDTYEDMIKAGRHRPGQGVAHGDRERRQHRQPAAHHRGPGGRDPRGEAAASGRSPGR